MNSSDYRGKQCAYLRLVVVLHSNCTVFQSTGTINVFVTSTHTHPYAKSSSLPTENILLLGLHLYYFPLPCVLEEAGGECCVFFLASYPNIQHMKSN